MWVFLVKEVKIIKKISKALIIFSFCYLLVLSVVPTCKAGVRYRYASTTLNIRSKPSTKSKVVGRFYFNDKIKIIKKVNKKWYLIKYKKKERYVAKKYTRKNMCKYKSYDTPTSGKFKSYEDANCITNRKTIPQGKLKENYILDENTGVWTVDGRYCIAIGSYYTKSIGIKVDLVLSDNGKKHILHCITADSKADKDTVNNHRTHRDGSIVEFVVSTSNLPKMARRMGDVSYAGKQFKGSVKEIRVY